MSNATDRLDRVRLRTDGWMEYDFSNSPLTCNGLSCSDFPQQVVADTNVSAIATQLENLSTGYHIGSPIAEHHLEDTE